MVIYGPPTPGMVIEFDYRVIGKVMFIADLYVDGKTVKSETMIALKGLNKFRYSGNVTEKLVYCDNLDRWERIKYLEI